MNRPRTAWFAVVLILVVVVVGGIEAGHLSGTKPLTIGSVTIRQTGGLGEASGNLSTGAANFTQGGGANGTSNLRIPIGSSSPQNLALSDWPLYLLVAAALVAGLLVLFRSTGQTAVYDFAAVMNQLDSQRAAMESSWSRRLRNIALIRYYSLLRGICSQMGLPDLPSETPHEYLVRVAEVLKVDVSDASGFASAFERARYGLELSDDDARDAAAHMGKFVDGFRGRFGA